MNGTKVTGKIIGEVEKITGIPKRDPKHYIKQRTGNGYWAYSGADIKRAQLTALCRSLDLPAKAIRAILADHVSRWQKELERQIVRLTDRLARPKTQLRLARSLQGHRAREVLPIFRNLAEKDYS